MKENGRKNYIIKNASSQMTASLTQSLLGFVSRRVFLLCLGEELLGLNGFLTSIIGMLSIAELGVGEAINFSLYEPLAKNDTDKVAAIMRLYKKLYIVIACVIGVLGVALFPFLHLLVETQIPMRYVYNAYFLFLLDTFLSYCLAYNRNIISADQKDYIVINIDNISQILLSLLQIALLYLTKNFYIYLGIKVAVTFIRNLYIYIRAKKMYPYLGEKRELPALSKEYTGKLKENVKALFVTRISYFCVSGTDNLLLSSFVSLSSIAIYNNYVTIFTLFNRTFHTIFDKTRSVIGNYIVINGKTNTYPLFKRMFFLNFLLTSYTSIGIFVVSNAVICAWLGNHMVWTLPLVGILVFNNYSRYILQTCEAFRGAMGLYSPRPFVKFLALVEGLLNLAVSLGLIFLMENKILAVFLGTAVSTVISTVCVPWIVYKFIFERPLGDFFRLYFKYLVICLAALVLSQLIFDIVCVQRSIANVFIGIGVCTAVTGIVYVLCFFRTEEFRYYWNLVKSFLRKITKSK